MEVLVLGSGTSMGVPTMSCDCDVCRSPDPRNRRLRASILVEIEGQRLLVDCSTDFREQSIRHEIHDIDALLLTHSHADHIGGLDELRIFCIVHKKSIPIYGPAYALDEVRARFDYCFRPSKSESTVPSFQTLPVEGTFRVGKVDITCIPVKHGPWDVFGFRMGRFVYVTDASYIPEESLNLMKGCEVMILNGLRRRPHPTHFSIGQAVEIVREVGAKQAYFTHMCHDLDHAPTNRDLPPGMALAYDGLRFSV